MSNATAASEQTVHDSADQPALPESADVIPHLRTQIDALDDAIARLVAERVRVSRRIQSARLNAGGTRVELGRERLVLARYRKALGAEGAALADAVLRYCRGSR
jgi:chorismate mutase